MVPRCEADRIPRIPLSILLAVTIAYLVVSTYMAVVVFPHEPVLDYGIGTTTRSTLWAGPISRLRSLGSPGAYFGILAYLLGSGILLWLIKVALLDHRLSVRIWSLIGAVAWWFPVLPSMARDMGCCSRRGEMDAARAGS